MLSSRVSRPISVRALIVGASLLALTCAAGAARADTPAAPDAAAPGPGDIVVTATRRAEIAKDVPIAVTAISGDKLNVLNSSGLDIRFLSSRTPSLQIESSFGRTQPRFYIRGLGNTDFDVNAPQPVSVVYDDIALESSMLKSFPVFDLASVEVLRGPQGTLFGRNTPAGVIKLNPALPGSTFTGYGQIEYGTYNTINGELAFGGPLGQGFSFRLSGLIQSRDGWVTNDDKNTVADGKLEGYQDKAGRAQIAYESGDFHARIEAHGRDLEGTPRLFRAGLFEPGSNHFNPGFDPKHISLDGYTSQKLSQWGTNLHLDYHFEGLGTLYSITGYERGRIESTGDIDGGSSYTFTGGTLGDLNVGLFPDNTGGVTKPREFSQEVRFASDEFGGLRLQGGAYYFHQKLSTSELAYNWPPTGIRSVDLNQDIEHYDLNTNYGIFASAEYKATDRLTLRAGVRYSHDHKNDLVTGFAPASNFPAPLPARAKVSGSAVTWDGSATYAITPAINLYARAATGYQGPAIQDRVTFFSSQTTAPKESVLSGEAGIKGATPDHRLSFALDGYWYRAKHFQITAVGGAFNTTQLFSANHVTGYGAELEVEARPVENLTLTASGSYNFTRIHDPSITAGVCGGGCTVTDPIAANGGAIIDGNPLPQAPKWIANVTARYDYPLANGDKIFVSTDWAYRGAINYFVYTALEFRGRSLTEGGARLGYHFRKGFEVAVFSRNITNQIRSISAIDFNNLTGMINDPRIVGGEVSLKF